MDHRVIRQKGEVLRLGEMSCRIEGTEGRGGSSIVYRAVYQDNLISGSLHHVLIKELYPWTADNAVYRNEVGWICCTQAGQEILRSSRESFLDGNEANLTMLEQMPEQVSGNLNSFDAYGTCYSVLTLHGGRNLQRMLDSEDGSFTLRESAEILLHILDALECFHRCRLLHLDLSPDNVLILNTYALLIDYNSVWRMGGNTGQFRFSEKEGYTSPEVRMKEFSQIGPCSDLYSAAAILFRLLAGRKPTNEDILGKNPAAGLTADLPVFRGEPASACAKMVQIVRRGLHVLARKRYQNTREMRADLKEVLLRLDRKGVTFASLWEGSRAEYRKTTSVRQASYLSRSVRLLEEGPASERSFTGRRAAGPPGTADVSAGMEIGSETAGPMEDRTARGGEIRSEEQVFTYLVSGGHLLLTGIGGIGKTSLLEQIWGLGSRIYSEKAPVLFYIPLAGYRESGQEAFYVRKYILRQLNLADQRTMDAALQELNRLLEPEETERQTHRPETQSRSCAAGTGGGRKGTCRWVFLLDGLNEAGPQSERLLQEIEELGRKPEVGLLVTDRTAEVKQYALKNFKEGELLPLSEETVRQTLISQGLKLPEEADLLRSLTNPMMLALYRQILNLNKDTSGAEDPDSDCVSMQGMIDRYMEALCTRELRKDAGSQRDQLRHRYLLQHLLPEIARQMARKGRNLLTREELATAASDDFRKLRGEDFAAVFPEYLGKSRQMLEGIANGQEWFDYAVSEQLIGQLGLLEADSGGGFRFAHDNFMECLAVHGDEHYRALSRRKRRRIVCWSAAALLAAVLAALTLHLLLPHNLSAEEQKLFRNASEQLAVNTAIVNQQLFWLDSALEEAGDQDVLDGWEWAVESAQSSIRYALQTTDRQYDLYYIEEESYIAELKSRYPSDIPSAVMTELLNEPVLMQEFLLQKLTILSDQVETGTADEIQESVEVLTEYMNAYTAWYYLKFCSVLLAFDKLGAEDAAEDLIAYMNDSGSVFSDCIIYYGLGTIAEERLETALSTAQDQLNRVQARVEIYVSE